MTNAPLSQFFANITKTVSASGIQFLIMLCTTPIMTRLYQPTAYAVFGIVNTLAVTIVGIGLLSLPNAYVAEKLPTVRHEIIVSMLVLLGGLVVLAAAIASVLSVIGLHHDGIDIPKFSLMVLPLLVLTYGIRQIMANMAIQRASFSRLSLSQVIEPVCARGGSIALGWWFWGNPAFILASVVLGQVSTMLVLSALLPKKLHSHWRSVVAHLPHLISSLKRYGDFVFFGTMSQQALNVLMLGLQISIAAYFSSELAGQYILATSILTLPVTLISLATAPVVYHHFIETKKNAPERLPRHFLLAGGLYLTAGTILMLPIFFFGEEIFKIAFGPTWLHAGRIAGVLSVAYISTFAVTGVQSMFMVTRRLKLQFMLEASTCIGTLLACVLCFKTIDFDRAIFYLSLLWILRNGMLLLAAFTTAFPHPQTPHE